MLRLKLTKYKGKEISEIPKYLQREILKGFEMFDKKTILGLKIQTWDDFLKTNKIFTGEEAPEVYKNLFENALFKEEVKHGIFKIGLNILSYFKIEHELNRLHRDIAIVNFRSPFFIADADVCYFGYGHFAVDARWEEPCLLCDLCNYQDALEFATNCN